MVVYVIINFIIYHFSFFYSTKVITNLLYINNGDSMQKRFKPKKKFKIKYISIIIILIIIFLLFNFINKRVRNTIANKSIIKSTLNSFNNYSYVGVENESLSNDIVKYVKSNFFNSPVNMLKTELKYNNEEKKVVNFLYGENKKPRIYIYNSHQHETYSIEYLEAYNIVPNVLMASNMLKDKLEDKGIYTIVEESDITLYMKENNLNHAGSYIASKYFLTKILESYPNLDLYIDLHRDAATHQVSTTTINDKSCAKVLFIIGLDNPNYENNLKIVTEINNIILEKYPSLTRGIMKKQGYGVNGVYNQDLNSKVILIEIGGNENNIEEVNNTLDLISEVIGEYLNEKG